LRPYFRNKALSELIDIMGSYLPYVNLDNSSSVNKNLNVRDRAQALLY